MKNNLTISIGCDNTLELLKSKCIDIDDINRKATATTMKLPYENKDEYVIHIHEKVVVGSQEWQAAIAAHEAYHYCLYNYSTEDEEYFAYKIEETVASIIHEINSVKNKLVSMYEAEAIHNFIYGEPTKEDN